MRHSSQNTQQAENVDNSCKTAFTDALTADSMSQPPNDRVVATCTAREEVAKETQNPLKRTLEGVETTTLLKKRGPEEGAARKVVSPESPSIISLVGNAPDRSLPIKFIPRKKPEGARVAEGPCLRDKYAHLLPEHMRLRIGYAHSKLVEKMCCIDRCIAFHAEFRGGRMPTFEDVVKSALVSMKTSVSLVDLRQILFLDRAFYGLEWKQRDNSSSYSLLIQLPQPEREASRKAELRRRITDFLKEKYTLHLSDRGIRTNGAVSEWGHGFDVESVGVPLGDVPLHPLEKKIALKDLDKSAIQRITNTELRQVIEDTLALGQKPAEQPTEAPPRRPESFKSKLYELVRQKEKLLQEKRGLQKAPQCPQRKQLEKFCQEACSLFISRRVTTMFRVSFLEAMRGRMEAPLTLPELECLLEAVLGAGSGFLEAVQSQKGGMIRVQKEKYNEMLARLESL